LRTALIIGAGAIAVYFLMRSPAFGAVPAPSGAGMAGQPTIYGTKPPASIATPNTNPASLSGAVALSNAGCTAIAGSKGVPSGLASEGCKLYSLVTPLGVANKVNSEIVKIPYVGGKINAAETAVSNTAKSVYKDLTGWL
jgi:hypothetical protein